MSTLMHYARTTMGSVQDFSCLVAKAKVWGHFCGCSANRRSLGGRSFQI